MKNCKRPRMKNQETDFYETRVYCSKEEMIQRCGNFMKKVYELSDERTFTKFVHTMRSFKLDLLSSVDANAEVTFLLRNHDVLLEEFNQLLLYSVTKKKNPKQGLDEAEQECINLTPSYSVRPEAKKLKSSSSSWCNEILNERYVSKGEYDESRVKEKRLSWCERRMNNIEDTLFEEDMYLKALISVVEFGNRVLCNEDQLNEKLPVGLIEVVRRFYEDIGKIVPRNFRIDPKRAVQGILCSLQDQEKKMNKAKELKVRKIYDFQQQKNNVNK